MLNVWRDNGTLSLLSFSPGYHATHKSIQNGIELNYYLYFSVGQFHFGDFAYINETRPIDCVDYAANHEPNRME